MSMDPEEPVPPFRIVDRVRNTTLMPHQRDHQRNEQRAREEPLRPVFRIGGSVIQPTTPDIITSKPPSPAQQGIPSDATNLIRISGEDLHGNQLGNTGTSSSKREAELEKPTSVAERADVT